jgi:hypothetical protein
MAPEKRQWHNKNDNESCAYFELLDISLYPPSRFPDPEETAQAPL